MKSTSGQSESIIARGKIFELVHLPQPDGRVFEVARRAPGTRIIIADMTKRQVLLSKEFRTELGDWDFRLPGGKVFDTLAEYDSFRTSGDDILPHAERKATAEAREEVGIDVSELKFVAKSVLGATVEWNLFVFATTTWQTNSGGQQLEAGERVESAIWIDFAEAQEAILNGQMSEQRIALVLLQWLHQQKG